MISEVFTSIIDGMITRSAPQTRDQSAVVFDNIEQVVKKLPEFDDQLNQDKAGLGEAYKLGPRYGVGTKDTVFVYDDRPSIKVNASALTAELMNNIQTGQTKSYIDGLVAVYGGTDLTAINFNALYNATALREVHAPSVTTLGEGAFKNCTELVTVDLPAVTTVGIGAFAYDRKLESISLPSATSIGNDAFNKCLKLVNVDLPAATELGAAFKECPIEKIVLPSLASIWHNAFADCPKLSVVDFGSTLSVVTGIDASVTGGLASATIVVPDTLLTSWKATTGWTTAHVVSQSEFKVARQKDLEDYQPKSAMSDYVKTSSLSVYAKTSEIEATYLKQSVASTTYAKKTDLANYDKKTDVIDGLRVELGTKIFESTQHSHNINGCQQITFTPESIGMVDGEKIVSFTVRTRDNNFNSVNVCLKLLKKSGSEGIQIGVSDMVSMTEANHDYKFTFASPVKLTAGTTYVLQFHDRIEFEDTSLVAIGARIYDGGSGYVSAIFINNQVNWRPVFSAEFTAVATVASIKKLITETAGGSIADALAPLASINQIGDDDYGVDDVKDRLDVVIGALKSLL